MQRAGVCPRGLWLLLAAAVFPAQGRCDDAALREEPLATRSGPRGNTMFTELSPQQTGIVTENDFSDPRMWNEQYQELIFGEVGTGVAIGDYDGDGRPDIFVVSKTGQCRLFRNLGRWKFEDKTAAAGLTTVADGGWFSAAKNWVGLGSEGMREAPEFWKQGATFADINNDGHLDIYVCRFNAPNLLYLNQGNGTFKEEAAARGLAITDGSCMAAFCDYDRDGWLDVFIHTNMLDVTTHPNGRRSCLLHNNGDGTFANVTDKAGLIGDAATHSATWWDYDNDGWPDLYVANDYAPADVLYHNNRDGTFTDVVNKVVPHMPYYAMGADLGDVNNDGRIDLFVADMAATNHEKDFRGMAPARSRAQESPVDPAVPAQYMRNALYLQTGTDRMTEAAILAGVSATDWSWSPRLEDLDNDGYLDLFVTNGMIREYHNADLLARVMSAENLAAHRQIVKQSPPLSEMNVAFRNLGGLRFEKTGKEWGLDRRGVSFGSALGDLDGDGDLDLVFSNYESGLTVMRNDSDTGHRLVVVLRGTRSNRFGVGAKVTLTTGGRVQVRQLVLARGYLSSSEPVLQFGLGDDSVIAGLKVEWPSGNVQHFKELPADRRLTITEPDSAAPQAWHGAVVATMFRRKELDALVAREDEVPETSVQPLLPFRFDRRGPALAAGVSRTSADDVIFLGGTAASPMKLSTGITIPGGGADDGPVLLIDYDSDGDLDLLRTKIGPGQPVDCQPRIYRNDGDTFTPVDVVPRMSINAGAAVAADFDRDGDLDVFIGARFEPGGYPDIPASVLLRNDGGRFVDVTPAELKNIGMVTAALWSDADNDGWPDLLVATEWGTLRLFHNDHGQLSETRSAGFSETGLWTSLASADFNRDGVADYVVGNIGGNTPYHAPAILYSANFRGGGTQRQIVEAFMEGDREYPFRSKQDLGSQIPNINRKFPRNDVFARATMQDILGDQLASATRLEANELRSGVYLSQPAGGWKFSPLPRYAQIAPLQGVVTGDFDGDGRADIYAVQNMFGVAPATGRFDGGISQLLLGDGRGGFAVVPADKSGIVVPGDAKAVLAVDLNHDGWPDFVVSRNGEAALAFTRYPPHGQNSFRVVLDGAPGNPTAIGAVLTLELADGSKQRAELSAGSGYCSQQPPGAFFTFKDGAAPKTLTVRWPDGKTTSSAMPREIAPVVRISER